jgi:DNA primase
MDIESLANLLASHGLMAQLVSGGRELASECPLCDSDKPKLYISTSSGAWLCYRCGEKGSLFDLLVKVCQIDRSMAMALSARYKRRTDVSGPPTLPEPVRVPTDMDVQPPPGYQTLAGGWEYTVAEPFKQYLAGRDVDYQAVLHFQLGMVLIGEYANRVIVPVKTEGVVRTWVARTIGDGEPKVRNAPNSDASLCLFNIDRLDPPHVVLVEGVFDAMRISEFAAATLGAHLTVWQRRHLKRRGFTDVTLLRDNDEVGQHEQAKEAMELVAAGFRVYLAQLPEGIHDPGMSPDTPAATRQQLYDCIKAATPVTETVSESLLRAKREKE